MKVQQYIVVDDDATNNLICEYTIRKFDKEARIKLYQEPEEALKEISDYNDVKSNMCTILFLDVNMPTMSGFEFLDKFLKFSPVVREQFEIYMLTSSIEDFNEQAQAYPIVSGFMSKPLKVSNLEEIRNDIKEKNLAISENSIKEAE